MLTTIILLLLGVLVLRGLSSSPRSILHIAGVAVAICVGFTLVFSFRGVSDVPFLIDESHVGSVLHSVSQRKADLAESTEDSSRGPSVASHLDQGDMLVLPLSEDFVAGLLGPTGAEAAAKLNASIPPELRQAYALIPLSATAPRTAGPVIRHALSPTGFRALLSALSHVWPAADLETQLPAEAITEKNLSADLLPAAEPPEWIDNPGIGQTVVQSKFIEASVPATEALRPAIIGVLKQRVTAKVSSDFAADADWEKIVELDVTDRAVQDSFRQTYTRTEVIDTAGNPTPMRQTFALIEFPDDVEEQILADIETALKRNRVVALCITLGIMWLCAVLLSLAFRAGQHGSVLRKLATVPVMALLILPCLVAFLAMTSAMANGRTFDFSWADNRISCVVDHVRK